MGKGIVCKGDFFGCSRAEGNSLQTMANSSWFCGLLGKHKKEKGVKKSSEAVDSYKNRLKLLDIKIEGNVKTSENDELRSTSFSLPVPFPISGASRCKVKVMSHESPVGDEVEEVAYEGEDEHDENLQMKRDDSDFDLQARVGNSNEESDQPIYQDGSLYDTFDLDLDDQCEMNPVKGAEENMEMAGSGHISDPGTGKAEFWASPKLLRSCSDLGMRDMVHKIYDQLPPKKSQSFEEMQKLVEKLEEVLPVNAGSPFSAVTHCSADKVMLKKHSSSQILPSRSRRLWWKLFLWSHRNLHNVGILKPPPVLMKPALNQQGGYSSDTLEPRRVVESSKVGSPNSFTEEYVKNGTLDNDNKSWDYFHGTSALWPQNQWVALPLESPTPTRVDEWVKGLSVQHDLHLENDANIEDSIDFPPSPEAGRSPARRSAHLTRYPIINIPEDVAHANSVIQSLNSSSTVAHIVGIGLKVVPHLWRFSSLRSVNLSGNFIVHITPGSLPKGLHTLNLSRNKINTIEGLRELTRLRVLDLSYNRISRISQGLSNCTLVKELYLAGNKISDVEGLHRLLKLTILDLSFNKITTTKVFGQLVANYDSLLALNLLGNPIQSNITDDQLRKTVCSLLPKLAFLNKQPINPQKAREAGTEAIAKVALGDSNWSPRRKAARKVSQGGLSSSSVQRSNGTVAHRSRHKAKNRAQYHSSLKAKSSNLASSSR